MLDLVGNPEDRFSRVAAQLKVVDHAVTAQPINENLLLLKCKQGYMFGFALCVYNLKFSGYALAEPHHS